MLSASLCAALLTGLRELEERFDHLLDVEWAADESGLWWLQARPLTSVELAPEELPSTCHTSWFFDQRFNQPISPLTRTTLMPLIEKCAVIEPLAMLGLNADGAMCFYGGIPYVAHRYCRAALQGIPRSWIPVDARPLMAASCCCED